MEIRVKASVTMPRTKVLITVTTYPLPSSKYQELVCTAGVLENGDWIRIYPIPLSSLVKNRFRKYHWIELDLDKRDAKKDFRPETHTPKHKDLADLAVLTKIGTDNSWEERKKYCLKHCYTSMDKLIEDAHNKKIYRSLAVFKPKEIIDFEIIEDEDDWKPQWKAHMQQLCMDMGDDVQKINIRKVPYKFKYVFTDEDGKKRNMMVEDWEIGQLYWNCLRDSNNNKAEAIKKVRQRCFDDLAKTKDLYFFLGTTLQWHQRKARNPFVIVGLFYPTKVIQPSLF